MITTRYPAIKLCVFLVTCVVFAAPTYALRPIVIFSGGLATPLGQESQSFNYANTDFNYQPNDSSSLNPEAGIFGGIEVAFKKGWSWQFGLAYYQGKRSLVSGDEIQAPADNQEAKNLWYYQYKILSRQFFVENKFSFVAQKIYHPYALVGVGERFNHVYSFQATPSNEGEIATAIFGDHTNHAFAYTIGFGADIDISSQVRIGAGYRYAYLGKYDLGNGTLDTGAGGEVFIIPAMKSQHSYNQEVLLQLTYLLPNMS